MEDDTYLIGDQNFDTDHKDFVILKTKKGQDITVALTASGIPFKGRLTSSSILFKYDTNYSSEVKEIIEKITSDNYAALRQEIREHRGKDELYFIPTAAKILRMTEGTLRSRPMNIQLAVCKRYADIFASLLMVIFLSPHSCKILFLTAATVSQLYFSGLLWQFFFVR